MKQDKVSAHYQGRKGEAYFSYQNQGNLHRGRINARKFAPYVRPADTVLDFGCGNGSLLYHLNCRRRIGLEINPAAIAAARKLDIEVHEDLETITPCSVDLVISNHALEHVLAPVQTLQLLREKLVPDGRLVFCLPIDDWRTQQEPDPADINHHLYTWTPLLFGNLLTEAGFAVERAWVYHHAWPPRLWRQLDERLPVWLFDWICNLTARRYKRRQLMAVAQNRTA